MLEAIHRDTQDLGFAMASEPKTGALLRVLAASKPSGRFLELGTGTGVGTAWLLAGMDATSRLESVDSDENVLAVARRHLGADSRVTFTWQMVWSFWIAFRPASLTSSTQTRGPASSHI